MSQTTNCWIEGKLEKHIFEGIMKLKASGVEQPEKIYMNKATLVSLLYESHNVVASVKSGELEYYIFDLKIEERKDLKDNNFIIQ